MTDEYIHLEAAGTALVLGVPKRGLPFVLHWGAPLGPLAPGDLR